MTNFLAAKGVDNLKKIIDGLTPKEQHAILFQLGDMRAVILVDKTKTPTQIYYNDLTGRPANLSIRKLFLNLHDVYEIPEHKEEIIRQTKTEGRTDHVKSMDEALAEINLNIAKNAWDVVKAPEKVSGLSMFSNSSSTSTTQFSNTPPRRPS